LLVVDLDQFLGELLLFVDGEFEDEALGLRTGQHQKFKLLCSFLDLPDPDDVQLNKDKIT